MLGGGCQKFARARSSGNIFCFTSSMLSRENMVIGGRSNYFLQIKNCVHYIEKHFVQLFSNSICKKLNKTEKTKILRYYLYQIESKSMRNIHFQNCAIGPMHKVLYHANSLVKCWIVDTEGFMINEECY